MAASIRRSRALATAFLLVLCACGPRTDRQFQELYDSTTREILRGEMARARLLSDRGLALAGNERDSPWPWKFRLLQDEIRLISRDLAEPFPNLDATLSEHADFAWVRAKQRQLKGQLALVRNRFAQAVDTLNEARTLAMAASANDVLLDAEMLKGVALLRLGRSEEADTLLAATAGTAQQARDRYREASAVVNRGMGYLLRNRYDEALPFFEHVVAMNDVSSLMVYTVALRNAGVSYAGLGDFDRAIAVQRRSVEVNEKRGPKVYLEQALGVLGATFVLKGSHREALEYLRRAHQVALDGKLYEDAARWADNLTSAYATLRDWDNAEHMNAEARRLNELAGTRTFVYNTYHRAGIAAGRGQRQEAAHLYETVLSDTATPPSLKWEVQVQLGGLSADDRRLTDASRHFRAALDIIEGTRSELLATDYKLSFLTRLIQFYEHYVDVLVDRRELDTALTIADSSRARVLAERHGIVAPTRPTVASFRRAAADLKSVLLFYWIGSAKSYAWLIAGDRIRFVPLATNAAEIGQRVRDYQKAIVESLGDPVASGAGAGDQLYVKLIAPVAPFIPHGTRVVIVPDGELNTLNFETLPVPGATRRYWIQDVEVAIAPSLGTLSAAARPAASRQDRSVLLIGDPVSADPAFPQLRYASVEMTAVSAAFAGRTSVYRAAQATPGSYRESKPNQFDIVHFTAHASANAESPLDSAVILSRDGSGYKLYARDVAEQSLSANLVTISACRSAGERTYAGEGLVGFAWAFLRAGAQRVIAGLWDVDDRSTADLMGRVYAQIAQGHSPAAALRAAKLEMITRGGAVSKPYYWGPFQVFIGSRVVP